MVDDRVRALEVQLASLKADLAGHVALCDGRWRVARMFTAALSGIIALAVSAAVALLTR